MNWLTTSSGAPADAQDSSPRRIRISTSFPASFRAVSTVSVCVTPTSTSSPSRSIRPTTAPSTLTSALLTLLATARTGPSSHPPAVTAFSADHRTGLPGTHRAAGRAGDVHDVPMKHQRTGHPTGSTGSRQSLGSAGSLLSVGSAGSILSIGSSGSILSIGSAGSILSIGSAGSVLSIASVMSAASVASALSVGSVLSLLSAFSAGRVLTAGALAGVLAGKLAARRTGRLRLPPA